MLLTISVAGLAGGVCPLCCCNFHRERQVTSQGSIGFRYLCIHVMAACYNNYRKHLPLFPDWIAG